MRDSSTHVQQSSGTCVRVDPPPGGGGGGDDPTLRNVHMRGKGGLAGSAAEHVTLGLSIMRQAPHWPTC